MKLRLLVIGPNNRTFSHIAYQTSIRLGSHPDCELPIPNDVSPVVSRYHAMIDLTDDGVFVTDLQSTNGTWLNGKKLAERTLLQPADELRLGQQGPIVRAFPIDDAGGEGTVHESSLPRPQQPAKPKAPPPPPVAPLSLSPPPPLPAAARAQARSDSRAAELDDRSGGRPASRRAKKSNAPLLFGLIGAGVLVLGSVAGILIWQFTKKKPEEPAQLTPEEIYKRVTPCATYIMVPVPNSPGNFYTGTGSLIDKDRRLILTAYHVIQPGRGREVDVYFAKYDKDGKLITTRREYGEADAIKADIIAEAPTKDLAILRLRTPPPKDAQVMPLASSSPEPGQDVYTVGGAPAESIGLWVFSHGNVREVQSHQFPISGGQIVDAWVIQTSNPINEGDSGGALVNKRCELVGVCCANMGKRTDKTGQTKITADLVRAFIDIREVKKLLETIPGGAKTDTKIEPKVEPKVAPKTGTMDRLVGRWLLPNGAIFEFMRDGKLSLSGPGKSFDGRYSLTDGKLSVTLNINGKDETELMTIKTLTETSLVLIDSQGMEMSMTRAK